MKAKKAFLSKYEEFFGIDSQIRFRLVTTLKILFTTVASGITLLLLLWLILEVDFLFFNSFEINGQTEFKLTFYDYISDKVSDIIPYVALFCLFIIGLGIYTSNLMLRPFKQISTFCLKFEEDPANVANMIHGSSYVRSCTANNAKRCINYKRDWCGILCHIFIPAIMVSFGLWLTSGPSKLTQSLLRHFSTDW